MKHNRNLLDAQLPDMLKDREEEKPLTPCGRQEDQQMEEVEQDEEKEEEKNDPVVLKPPSIESSQALRVASTETPSADMSTRMGENAATMGLAVAYVPQDTSKKVGNSPAPPRRTSESSGLKLDTPRDTNHPDEEEKQEGDVEQ